MNFPKKLMVCYVGIFCMMLGSIAVADKLYRYKNHQGTVVIDKSIPVEFSSKGYQIITEEGRVLRTVAPELSEAQKALLGQTERDKIEAKEQAVKDKELLRIFSDGANAERARDRQIEAIQLRADYFINNKSGLSDKLNTAISKAANVEKSGKVVPDELKKDIEMLKRRVENTLKSLADLEIEKEVVAKEYQPIIDRLNVLRPNKKSSQVTASASADTKADVSK